MGQRCARRCLLRRRRRYAFLRLLQRYRKELALRSAMLLPELFTAVAAQRMESRDLSGAAFYVLIALGVILLVAVILPFIL